MLTVLAGGLIAVWLQLDRTETEKLRLRTEITAEQLAARIEQHIAVRLSAVDMLRKQLEQGALRTEWGFFEQALLIQNKFPGFQAINWVNSDGIIRWVTPFAGNEPALNVDITAHPVAGPIFRAAAQGRTGKVATPPITLLQGGTGFVAFFPVYRVGAFQGMIGAVFRGSRLVDDAVGARVQDNFNIQMQDDGAALFSLAEPAADADASVRVMISVADRRWELALSPNVEAPNSQPVVFGKALIALGFLLGAVTIWLLRATMLRHAELRTAKDEADHASQAKSDFLANVSHELRTPLNAIIGFSEIMQQGKFGPISSAHYRHYVDLILESGHHLLAVINNILDISKAEAGRIDLRRRNSTSSRSSSLRSTWFAARPSPARSGSRRRFHPTCRFSTPIAFGSGKSC